MTDEDFEVAVDLQALAEEADVTFLPPEEPQARALHPDGRDPNLPVGYSHLHPDVFHISVAKETCPDPREAKIRFLSLTRKRGFRAVDGVVYWTATHWFYRVVQQGHDPRERTRRSSELVQQAASEAAGDAVEGTWSHKRGSGDS